MISISTDRGGDAGSQNTKVLLQCEFEFSDQNLNTSDVGFHTA